MKYAASFQNTSIAPAPIEVGHGLALEHRTRQWSRWTRSEDRDLGTTEVVYKTRPKDGKLLIAGKGDTNDLKWQTYVDDIQRANDVVGQLDKLSRVAQDLQLEFPESEHWLPWKEQISSSVVIGRVVYPTDSVKRVNAVYKGIRFSEAFWQSLIGRREFLTSSNGLQPFFPCEEDRHVTQTDYMLIKLSPKKAESPLDDATKVFAVHRVDEAKEADASVSRPLPKPEPQKQSTQKVPDLEIRVNINHNQRTLDLTQVRAVLQTWESDILQPHKPCDLRFTTQRFVTASTEPDPQILAFIASSNLDVWGSARLKTPSCLTLSVPHYGGSHDTSEIPSANLRSETQSTSRTPAEYTFSSLEHHSQISYSHRDFSYTYTIIEAGRIGGRREEFRITAPTKIDRSTTGKGIISALYDRATRWVAEMCKRITPDEKEQPTTKVLIENKASQRESEAKRLGRIGNQNRRRPMYRKTASGKFVVRKVPIVPLEELGRKKFMRPLGRRSSRRRMRALARLRSQSVAPSPLENGSQN